MYPHSKLKSCMNFISAQFIAMSFIFIFLFNNNKLSNDNK